MADKRLRIAPSWLVGLMSASVVGVLAAAHPRGGIEAQVAATEAPSALSIAYLEALLRSKPDDIDLLTYLGNQYFKAGRNSDAREMAEKLAVSGNDESRRTGELLRLDVDSREAQATPYADPTRDAKLARVRDEVAAAANRQWPTPDLFHLATTAAASGAQTVAGRLYARLAVQDPAHAAQWHREVVRYAMYDGDYATAAHSWFQLQTMSPDYDTQRSDFMSGIKVLQSGNMLPAALAAADQYGQAFLRDRQVLILLLNLARAAGATDRVDRYAKLLAGYAATPVPAENGATLASAPKVKLMPEAMYAALGLADPSTYRYLDGAHPAARSSGATARVASAAYREAMGVHVVRVQYQRTSPVATNPVTTKLLQDANKSYDGPLPLRPASGPLAAPPVASSTPVAKPTAASDAAAAGTANEGDVPGLLYQSFLEANDLANAQRIATEQVAKPNAAPVWTRRLAQVAEWNNGAPLALQMWLRYAQATQDPEGWRNVQRIAPMLNDDRAYLTAITQASQGKPDDLALLDQVIATYERLGLPDQAMAYLERRAATAGNSARVEQIESRAGDLATRAGYDDKAMALYAHLMAVNPRSTAYPLRLANLQYRHGDYNTALQTLLKVHDAAAPDDVLYWRSVAQLARLQQRDDVTNDAYRHLLASGKVSAEDLAAMTFFYDPFPIDAGRTAEAQYQKDHTAEALEAAVHYYTDARTLDAAKRLLDGVPADEMAKFENDPNFLRVRSDYYRAAEQPDLALKDLSRAVDLPGATQDVQVSWLWALVDFGSNQQIRQALTRWPNGVEGSPPLWGPVAAANLRLNRPEAALRYLRLQAASSSTDPLWLQVYADALEMAGHEDLAWSVRRTVWRGMEQAMAAQGDAGNASATTDPRAAGGQANAGSDTNAGAGAGASTAAATRRSGGRLAQESEAREQTYGQQVALASIFAGADASRALLRSVIASDAGLRAGNPAHESRLGDAPGLQRLQAVLAGAQNQANAPTDADQRLTSAVAKDVAVAWALSHEGNEVARVWLARQYASSLSIPREQAMTLALADNDKQKIQQLLDAPRGALSANSAIDASLALDRQGQAEETAFRGLAGAPNSDVLHQRLLDTAMSWPQSVGAGVTTERYAPLTTVTQTAAASVKLGDHYMVGVNNSQRFQHSSDDGTLTNVPSLDTTTNVYLRHQTDNTAWTVSAGVRHGASTVYPVSVEGEVNRNGNLSGTLRVGRDQQADESQLLLIGGVKDNAVASARWNVTQRLYASTTFEAARYYSQNRNMLGSGTTVTGELGYRVRTQYPDYTVRVVGVRGDYHGSGQPDGLLSRLIPADAGTPTAAQLMPQSFTQYGAFIGFGNDTRDTYSHAWRPFVDVGIVHDSNQGWGPQATAGIGGSVLGGDRLSFYVSRQQVAGAGTAVTLMGVNYVYFY